jgi:HEAT repeat protein
VAPSGDLARRIDSASDETVRFRFPAREGVCGDGHSINIHEEDPAARDRWCERGPVWVDLERSVGVVTDLDLWVARAAASHDAPALDLGEVTPVDATDYLLALSRKSGGDVGGDAIAAASLAADVVIWPDLLDIARDDHLETDTREAAVFWLSQLAGEKATAGLEEIVSSDGNTEVKEAALFALSQLPDGAGFDALVTVVRKNEDPDLVQASLFWLGQTHDPRALALFEEILTRE